ncbi:MAG: hypothetical protein NTY66_01535 [Candidatus Vogelbacteria bacterium]|nr:hypothetical protein [Candidatus Vogelbacteria bacterium]
MADIKDIKVKNEKDTISSIGGLYQFVFQKIEKLTTALYMVTDFLTDSEPLKQNLRGRSIDLLMETLKIKKDTEGMIGWGILVSRLNEIVLLLGLGRTLSNVSQMNFEILTGEYQDLLRRIEENIAGKSLHDYLFMQNLHPARVELSTGDKYGESIRNGLSVKNLPIADRIRQKDKQRLSANDLYGLNSKDSKKSLRKEQISAWLKDKGWTNIAEIAKSLPDCGAKTVQRELLEMVSLGVLKKQGERRWSRYMLA